MRLAGVGLLAGWACAPGAPAPPPGSSSAPAVDAAMEQRADTLRGTVRETGSEPATLFVLQTPFGATVRLEGERPLLRRVAGLEVMLRGVGGAAAGSPFGVREVNVRASNGVPAVDGVLDRRNGGYVLVTRDGRALPVAHLPDALRGMIGGRIWLAGPLDQPPVSFGVLAEPIT
ncbi:MAG TPA: hypothetical protein VFJ82_10260 [Longimicrobium sp.]|nr:hypothetical protein [Longimicrobium sp.]